LFAHQAEIVNIRAILHVPSLQYKHLRTGPTSTTEYLIEVPKEIVSRVPKEWMRVNQTKQAVRYHSPTVLELYQRLMEAR
jgi:DNA mismatch repair protein MSH3